MIEKKVKIDFCVHCDKKFVGCACHKRKAEDGNLVHSRCLQKYNHIVKMKKEEEIQDVISKYRRDG